MISGSVRIGPQVAAQAEPVLAGHHDVEDAQVDAGIRQDAPGFAGILGGADAVAMLGEKAGQQIPDLPVIIDNQQVGRSFHRLLASA